MAFSKLTLFVSISVLAQMAAGALDLFKPLEHDCPSFANPAENFTMGSQYQKHLDLVLYNLSITAPTTGFAYGSAGADGTVDRIYGRVQCRPDISTADCQTCVGKIVRWIQQKCPVQKSAFGWFQGCLLRYAESDFYGKIDDRAEGFFILKKQNLSGVVSVQQLNGFFAGLAEEVYASEKMFAKGVVKLSGSRNLYGLVQCTQDASLEVCKTCVRGLIDGLRIGYGLGTDFYQTVCTLQYSFYPFFN